MGAGGIVSDLISWKGKSKCVSDLVLTLVAVAVAVAFPASVVRRRIGNKEKG